MSEKPVNIEKKDNLTTYVSGMLGVRLPSLPESMRGEMIRGAEAMSAIGVNSEEDHKDFMYILLHTRKIAEDISGQKLNPEIMSKLSNIVFSNRTGNPIDTIFNFYRAVGKGLNEMGIPIKKNAYPLGQSAIRAQTPRNTKKWMKTMREIYFMVHKEIGYEDALNHLTAEWDVMETKDFENWMSFYQEGAHEKYKTAKDKDDDVPSYLQFGEDGAATHLPFSALMGKLEKTPDYMPDMSRYKAQKAEDDEEAETAAAEEAERLEECEKKVRSIGGRLRSALRLLSQEDVLAQLDGKLDCSVADFVEQIQKLQRYILLIPLKNKKSSIIEDVIIQRGNRLTAQGYSVAGELMRKFAQEPEPLPTPPADPDAPLPTPPDPDAPPAAAPAAAPAEAGPDIDPGEDVGAPPAVEDLPAGLDVDEKFEDDADDAWVQAFKDNINNIKSTDKAAVEDYSLIDDMAEITVEAQEAMPLTEGPPPPPPPEEEAAIEVEEEPDIPPEGMPPEPGKDQEIKSLENVTVSDVVERLERVSNILKNREIPRELAWIDFMLDEIGLASYFPALAEATKSALESNQYMSTRVEDILSRLRGSIEPEAPLELTTTKPEEEVTEDTLRQVRQNLETGEKRERARKEQRQKEAPEEGVVPGPPGPAVPAEELAQPVSVETAPPAPVR